MSRRSRRKPHKARMAEDASNARDPQQVAQACTLDSAWRNRAECFAGRAAIEAFLTHKWQRDVNLYKFAAKALFMLPNGCDGIVAIS